MATRMSQSRTASFTPAIDGESKDCVRAAFGWPAARLEARDVAEETWEGSKHLKEEEFARAEALGLFDYMRKSRSAGFVVSLSGGADSTAVSCLVRLMVEMGVKELGVEGFVRQLAYIGRLANRAKGPNVPIATLVRELLICVYQGTENSGSVTRNAARGVAEAIGAEFLEFEVGSLVKEYVAIVSKGLGRKLAWETDDVALQNIQARVRSPGVWMLANIRNALLVSTSNRSEAAVGYATMDGDTSGGLSPIAGIDKAFLRQWLAWLETDGPAGVGPIPAVRAVNVQAPTAELRPAEKHQTDEDDLMPYPLLDAIERAAIRDKKTPVEVFQVMRVSFGEYSVAQLHVWVERFFRLWCRNQWKRERYAPSFHLDDENLDPKTWCRFPILSGAYERELAELREYVKGL
jgi:NAD+ synthase (glutamine-hydrolysing)